MCKQQTFLLVFVTEKAAVSNRHNSRHYKLMNVIKSILLGITRVNNQRRGSLGKGAK
jgi:hypothetical protein